MFVVYWLEGPGELKGDVPRHGGVARFERFDGGELTQALAFAEDLRKKQAAGGDVGFVSLCSENPQSVGRAGVADPPADYAWKKRRT